MAYTGKHSGESRQDFLLGSFSQQSFIMFSPWPWIFSLAKETYKLQMARCPLAQYREYKGIFSAVTLNRKFSPEDETAQLDVL